MTITASDWKLIMNSLSQAQKEKIKAKCNWEHVGWLGVFKDWPDLFINAKNRDFIKKIKLNI